MDVDLADPRLMFAQSWEDPECDRAALRIRPGDRLFAVTSGGDNVLDLLRDDPSVVVAVDLNPAQNWLFDLKREGMRQLDHQAFSELMGLGEAGSAKERYGEIRPALRFETRFFFDSHSDWFERGLLSQGGFERYFAILRKIIAIAVGPRTIRRLFEQMPEEQAAYYRQHWDGWRWRALMRIGCSKALLGNRLDPSWFADADETDFGGHFTRLAEHVLTELPARENHFLAQILLGHYVPPALPAYLLEENFDLIRGRLERVELVSADIVAGLEAQADASIDAFALSNVFEYSPAKLFDLGKDEVLRVARPGARIAHRNLLAPRRFGADERFRIDPNLSKKLQAMDRGFIYSRFEAASVR